MVRHMYNELCVDLNKGLLYCIVLYCIVYAAALTVVCHMYNGLCVGLNKGLLYCIVLYMRRRRPAALTASAPTLALIANAAYASAVQRGLASGTVISSGAASPYVAFSSRSLTSGGTFWW